MYLFYIEHPEIYTERHLKLTVSVLTSLAEPRPFCTHPRLYLCSTHLLENLSVQLCVFTLQCASLNENEKLFL